MTRRYRPASEEDDGALFGLSDLEPELVLPEHWTGLPDGPASRGMPTGKCLYDSPARGFASRVAEFALWADAYGHTGCNGRSHAWHPSSIHFSMHGHNLHEYVVDRCQPTVLGCDLRRDRRRDGTFSPVPPCGHHADAEIAETYSVLDGLLYRAACRKAGCDWEGPERHRENPAVEDGMDHAWPGWRDLPIVPRLPDLGGNPNPYGKARKTLDAWIAKVNDLCPAGWLESGGPIRTLRRPMETRHVEGRTPFGGYDLSVPAPAGEDR